MSEDIHKYDSIINIPHHSSYNHRPMTRYNRAAQFAPFAALTGYGEAINETGRIVDKKKELTNEEKEIISEKINYLISLKDQKPEVIITFFIKDELKTGGRYDSIKDVIVRLDEVNGFIKLESKQIINIEDIIDIDGETFNHLI